MEQQHYTDDNYFYCYGYSALGPVWAETRAQSGDWYVSGTLHPGQILRGSLPLLSPVIHLQDWIFNLLRKTAFVSLYKPYRYLDIIPTYISDENVFVMLFYVCHIMLHIQLKCIIWSRKCNIRFGVLFFPSINDSFFTFPSYRKHLYTTYIYYCIISPYVHIPPSCITELTFTANVEY